MKTSWLGFRITLCSMMQKLVVFNIALVVMFLSTAVFSSKASAGSITLDKAEAKKGIIIRNPKANDPAADFEITLIGRNGTDINIKDPPVVHKLGVNQQSWSRTDGSGDSGKNLTLKFDAPGASDYIGGGSSLFVKLVFNQIVNGIEVKDPHFTEKNASGDSVRLPNDPEATTGFIVEKDPIYTIFNDSSEPIGIRDLQFLVNVPDFDFDTIDFGPTPGFGPTLTDFILSANSSQDFVVPGTLDPRNWLFAHGVYFDVNTGEEVGAFIDGHQQVPEPSIWLMFGIGLLSYGWRQKNRTTRKAQSVMR